MRRETDPGTVLQEFQTPIRNLVEAIKTNLSDIRQYLPDIYDGLKFCINFCRYIAKKYQEIQLEARKYFEEQKVRLNQILSEAAEILKQLMNTFVINLPDYKVGTVDSAVKDEVGLLVGRFDRCVNNMKSSMETLKSMLERKKSDAKKFAWLIGSGSVLLASQITYGLRLKFGWSGALFGGSVALLPGMYATVVYCQRALEVLNDLLYEYEQMENDLKAAMNERQDKMLLQFIDDIILIVEEGNARDISVLSFARTE